MQAPTYIYIYIKKNLNILIRKFQIECFKQKGKKFFFESILIRFKYT
jgi:hypothetical protein